MQRAKGLKRKDFYEHFGSFKPLVAAHQLPPRVSYKYLCDEVDDQGQHNTCVAHGAVGMSEDFYYKRHGLTQRVELSRRALYYLAKKTYEPGDMNDDGLAVDEGLKVLRDIGYVLESEWPYTDNLFEPVPENLIRKDWMLKDFVNVPLDAVSIKTALYQHGPVVVGSQWPGEWDNPDENGMLATNVSPSSDGHCWRIIAYDDARSAGLMRNSWGPNWALGGYAWVPYAMLTPQYLWEAYTCRA